MASWGERHLRTESLKQDNDCAVQQDPNANITNPDPADSFDGGPLVNTLQDLKLRQAKRETSPSPHIQVKKGWSHALNASRVGQNLTGAVSRGLSMWERESKRGPPPELDTYATGNSKWVAEATRKVNAASVVPSGSDANEISTQKNDKAEQSKMEKFSAKPRVNATTPKTPGKLQTFLPGEKAVVSPISPMESSTLPRHSSAMTTRVSNTEPTVNSNPVSKQSSVVDVVSVVQTLEDRKKTLQVVKPVENRKEAPVRATEMKTKIAALEKVLLLEKQKGKLGSQQTFNSDGTPSPVPSPQKDDSLESKGSTLRSQNSIESSDSSSVVLKINQTSPGKASLQKSANLISKLFGKKTQEKTNTTPKEQELKKELSIEDDVKNSEASSTSTPTSPELLDARAELLKIIKNSNGNFGLKKTGSTFLPK